MNAPRFEIPANRLSINQTALGWLRKANESPDPLFLYLTQLAKWGLEQGLSVDLPGEVETDDLERQVDALLEIRENPTAEQATAYRWMTSNPNGPQRAEQVSSLEASLASAENPRKAAAIVLETISDRMRASIPSPTD